MEEKRKGIAAVDPGVGGGMAIMHPDGSFDLRPWTVEHEHLDVVHGLNSEEYISVVEDVPAFVSAATSNASSFKLGYNFGFVVACFRAKKLETHLVKPQIWQKGLLGLKRNMGYTLRKRVLKDNAIRLYPDLKITNQTSDAVLILDWARRELKWRE